MVRDNKIIILFFGLLALGGIFYLSKIKPSEILLNNPKQTLLEEAGSDQKADETDPNVEKENPLATNSGTKNHSEDNNQDEMDGISQSQPNGIPIDGTLSRVKLKPFGIKVSPETSPVPGERFSGYHTGLDFEIDPEEKDVEIPVRAICSGKVIFKGRVGGYGGTLVQICNLENSSVTVLYGHLSFDGYDTENGDQFSTGQVFSKLGADRSSQTDGERKHLHLSIHKGTAVEYRGYAQSAKQLERWIDPSSYLEEIN